MPGIPQILWKLYGKEKRNRARTLAQTVISLIPPPSDTPAAACRCRGRPCIRCSGTNAMSFLLRPDDPSDYRYLLNNCFVVVNNDAPALLEFVPFSHWSQPQIVASIIEKIKYESKVPNVICWGYDKYRRSSTILELLTSSAWCILLTRVGESVMVYLLMHSSIFLPAQKKIHHQVAGSPITALCPKFLKYAPEAQKNHPSHLQLASRNMRGGVDDQLLARQMAYVKTSGRHYENEESQMNLSEVARPICGSGVALSEGDYRELGQSSEQIIPNSRKRFGAFSTQCYTKRRQLDLQKSSIVAPLATVHANEDSERCQYDVHASSNCHHEKMPQDRCCELLLTSQMVDKQVQINRKSLFYNLESSSSIFLSKHVLNSLEPNSAGSDFLLRTIFGLSDVNVSDQSASCSQSSGFYLTGSPCLYHRLAKLLKSLIRRTKRCQYLRLLNKHCPIPSFDQSGAADATCMFKESKSGYRNLHVTAPLYEAIKSYSSKSQVVSFIWAVCRSIIPPDLLGTPFNWRILRRNIYKFIQLRRFEKFSFKQCMHKLERSRFLSVSKKDASCYLHSQAQKYWTGQGVDMLKGCRKLNHAIYSMKNKLLESWILWFFSFLVVPLVQAHFYVTESEHGKQNVYYYRKSVWKKLTAEAFTCLKDQNYFNLGDADVRNIIDNRSFGFSKLRFCPKENGLRMLANLKAPSKLPAPSFYPATRKVRYFKSVNSALRDVHAVLKGLKLKDPEKLGSSVFDYNDVYRQLCSFIVGLKNGLGSMPDVFIVISDVSKAFDSIDQDKLLTVMKEFILEDKYHLKQSDQVICTKKCLWVRQKSMSADHITTGLTRFSSSAYIHSLHNITIDKELSKEVTKQSLLFILKEHVKRNIVQLGKQFYLQCVGISQGSMISSLLCSIYFGHLERNVIFPFLEKTCVSISKDLCGSQIICAQNNIEDNASYPTYMLLRFIDDFLFISTSKKQAASFFSRLQRGFQDYNCYMNERKFSMNFDSRHVPGISFLRWSGLLINCHTLEVQADYTRYLKNHLSSTLTVSWQDEPGYHLNRKLFSFLRPKCHPIFFDSNINSPGTVRLNIFQAFLLSAMKSCCYEREFSCIRKLSTESYLKIIERSLRYMYTLIKKRMESVHLGPNLYPVLQLEEDEVEWLGLNAYFKVLRRKQTRHTELLCLLRSKLTTHRIAGSLSSPLTYAIDDSQSSVIWKIKY